MSGVSYTFSPGGWKESIYFFFYKKKCPCCHEKLRKEKKTISKGIIIDEVVENIKTELNAYEIEYLYICDQCNKTYTIVELTKIAF